MDGEVRQGEAVLVVGAGIAGMAAGLHLAELGHAVYLLDAAPAIGGSMHLLDHTFPTDSCGICLMLPQQPAYCPTFECDLHERISLLPYAELEGLEGEAGAYVARVRHKARLVDGAACTGCGACAAVCPEARPHDYEGWVAPVKAIYRPAGLRAVPDTWVIDPAVCTRCGACVAACPEGAIDLGMVDEEELLPVGAVLLTPGFAPFDARVKGEYGYGVYPNVLSALEFERMVSLAGSRVAHLVRPSDDRSPGRVAFVHCVGSRDPLCGAGHCSSVCCMYTAKQVALAKQIDPDLEVTVFFMDLRAMGKDFEAYVERVQALPGVTYRRAMPSVVHEQLQTHQLQIASVGEDGHLQEETFDLVVLAIGFAPPAGMQALARSLGVELDAYGFAAGARYRAGPAGRPGVFVAGAYREPKDIPDTVVEAVGVAAEVAAYLRSGEEASRPADEAGREDAGLRDVAEEEPRVGVFVCDCEGELAPLSAAEVAAWADAQPEVARAEVVAGACEAAGQAAIREAIEASGLNRVVVAGCSPRLYVPEMAGVMAAAGLDSRLLERVSLREQVVYPHWGIGGNGAGLMEKAQSLVGMAVAGLRAMGGVAALARGGTWARARRAVVVGGGAAGLAAGRGLAALGIPVELVERAGELGGQWREIRYQADGSDVQGALAALVAEVEADSRIRVHLGAEVRSVAGAPGAYRSVIVADGVETEVEHGVLVLAVGGRPVEVEEYLRGQHPAVLTQRELEAKLAGGAEGAVPERVVMIQCVGSREPGRPYCSRVCCTQAVKNALALKARWPEVEVYVLYREVRTFGVREAYYQAAREAGVVFVRYEVEAKPRVTAAGEGVEVGVVEPVTGEELSLAADWLVLSVGVEPEGAGLAERLGLAVDEDGFVEAEHAKMKPLDVRRGEVGKAAAGGVYVAGLAHSPRFVEEAVAQGQGAAMRAAAYLTREREGERATSVWVNERLCSFCGLCVAACPYEARVMNYETRVADVDYALCEGCGVCAMVCPNKATLQKTFEHKQVMATIDMALV